MVEQLKASIVRIFSTSKTIVGVGFLVSEKHVLTCAHVVAQALNIPPEDTTEMPTEEICLDFPLIASEKISARVIFWQPVQPSTSISVEKVKDIAVLELQSDPPDRASFLRLVEAGNLWEHPFRVFGFPAGHDDGVWASGVLREKQAEDWVQIEDVKESGFRVEQGFSGAPVWDEQLGRVVGMVVAAERRPDTKVAFIIPTAELIKALSQMKADRAFRTWRQEQLQVAMTQWQTSNLDKRKLLRGSPLVAAEHWLKEGQANLSSSEREYIEASLALRQQQELLTERKQLWRGVIFGIPISLLVGVFIGWRLENPPPVISPSQPCDFFANDVSALDFSKDGKFLVTASLDNTVRVLRVNTVEESVEQVGCEQHKDGVVAVKFSGEKIATASLDATAHLWNMDSNGNISSWKSLQHKSPVVAIDFSSGGDYLATASADGIVKIWDTNGSCGEEVALIDLKTYVRAVSFSSDGRYLAVTSLKNKARVWEWKEHKHDQVAISLPPDNVVAVAFSLKVGTYHLATLSADGTTNEQVQVWNTTNLKEVQRVAYMDKTYGYIRAISFSLNGRYLAAINLKNQARVWEWEKEREGQNVRSLPQENPKDVVTVAFSQKDEKYLTTVSADSIKVWETNNIGDPKNLTTDKNNLVDVAFSPVDENYLALASADGKIQIRDWKKGTIKSLDCPNPNKLFQVCLPDWFNRLFIFRN